MAEWSDTLILCVCVCVCVCVHATNLQYAIHTNVSLSLSLSTCIQPNGRFALHQKICLSASSYHPELWQPSWSSEPSIPPLTLSLLLYLPLCLSLPPSLSLSLPPSLSLPSLSPAVRTVLLAIIGFMPTEGVGAVGSLDCSTVERRRMAKR